MAVYTDISDDDLRALIAEYDIGEVTSCKGIAEGVENSNYLIQTTQATFILTLYEKRVNPDDLPYFLGLMDHLAAKDVACPLPVHGRDGKALRECAGRPCAIITFLPGMWPRQIAPVHCAELGRMMARMHLAAGDFGGHRTNALGLHGWRPLFDENREGADGLQPGLQAELATVLDDLEARWPMDLPAGVIHADLFPDNVFFIGEQCSGLIDFYFACNDFLAYDLAICLNAWCFERAGEFNATKARRMVEGYEDIRPLSDAERDALPLLAQGAALRFFLTRLHDWSRTPAGALVKPKDPTEYLEKLRFHRKVAGTGEYGLG